MNQQKRRSSREKKETPKAKEAKDDLKAKKQKKLRKLSDSPIQNDRSVMSTPSPRNSRRSTALGNNEANVLPNNMELQDTPEATEFDKTIHFDTSKPVIAKPAIKFASKFSPESLEEIFTFVSDNAENLTGQGDLAPTDLDTFQDDPTKEMNSQWLGVPYKVQYLDRVYYEAIHINGEEIRLFDHVILAVKQKPRNYVVTVARVIAFYEENGRKRVTLEWYYRPPEILAIMNRIKLTGVNPLTPVLDDSYDDDPKKPFKRKRGRPPKKRLLNIEDTVKALEESTDFEIFTSIRPYIDDLSVSSIGQKCIVDHVLPTWTPRQPAEKSKKWFFYRKALELKTCSLVICKARPNKPRIWIELLEKKNRELRLNKPKDVFHSSLNGSDYEKKKKKKKEKEEDDDLETDFDEEIISPFESENSEDSNTAFLSRNTDTMVGTPMTTTTGSSANIKPTSLYPHICETMKNLGDVIENKLSKMEKLLEGMTHNIRESLEELKGSLEEVKQSNVSNISIGEADGLDHDYDQLHPHSTPYQEIFESQFM